MLVASGRFWPSSVTLYSYIVYRAVLRCFINDIHSANVIFLNSMVYHDYLFLTNYAGLPRHELSLFGQMEVTDEIKAKKPSGISHRHGQWLCYRLCLPYAYISLNIYVSDSVIAWACHMHILLNIYVSTIRSNDLAPLGARTSTGTVMINVGFS